MPFAVPPVDTTRKPIFTAGMKVNWEHPLNRQLMSLFVFNGYGVVYDLVRKNLLTPVNGAYVNPQEGLVCNGSNRGMLSGMVDLDLPKVGTFVIRFRNLGATGTVGYLLHASVYTNFAVNYTSTGSFTFYTPDGHGMTNTGTDIANGNWHTLFIMWNDSTNLKQTFIDLYTYYISTTTYDFTMPPTTGDPLEISRTASTYDAAGAFDYIALHGCELNSAEVAGYCSNPYGTPDNPRLI